MKRKVPIKLKEETLIEILKKHFEDDKDSFTEIKKNQEKYQELLKISGEHFSSFASNLAALKESFDAHVQRVEPMLCAYEKDTAFSKSLGERAKKWGTRITVGAAIVAAIVYLKGIIVQLFLK